MERVVTFYAAPNPFLLNKIPGTLKLKVETRKQERKRGERETKRGEVGWVMED